MTFNYYYGSQADQFSFVRIPRLMLTDKAFQTLSMSAKVLYGVLLDRMGLSMKNEWFDKDNRVFIIYQISEIQEDLGLTKRKAIDLLSELEKFGLVEKKRRGHGLPNLLYVKSFMGEPEVDESTPLSVENETSGAGSADKETSDSGSPCSTGSERCTSRSMGNRTPEVRTSNLQEEQKSELLMNQTDKNHTDWNQTESDHIVSQTESHERYDAKRSGEDSALTAEAYRELICENIGYETLVKAHREDCQIIDGIVELILETVLCSQDSVLIASSQYPAAVVRSRFLKLNYAHIEYVLECLHKNTTRITNIRKYLLAVLFNAPTTMGGYYQALVQHDMPQLAQV